ncbi:hypothetical protein ACEPAI_8009 [Sanghuangporus weigelae]
MVSHISVLPKALLDALSAELSQGSDATTRSHLWFLRLPHPRSGLLSLFLPTLAPNGSSILELQSVAPNSSRSWFNGGEILSDGSMLLMTPIDPVFLLVPILKAASPQDGSLGNFRTLDDILEGASTNLAKDENAEELNPGDILKFGRLPCVQEGMRRICDTKDIASDLVVFRYSHSKLLEYLIKKANRLGKAPTVPESRTLERELAKDGLMDDGKEELLMSGRLKLACDLISQYVSPEIHEELLSKFDFSALTKHIASLEQMDLSNNTTTACGNAQKAQVSGDKNGKKRKVTGPESAGVAKLKKANTKGMAKLSSFFQKKP